MTTSSLLAALETYGITSHTEVVLNPSYEQLFQEETDPGLSGFEVGTVTESGAVAVNTGIFTGRSPKDKYIVKDDITADTVWWADQGKNDNKSISKEVWDDLKSIVGGQLSSKRLFVVDLYCGADEATRLKVRFVTEVAWQCHFVKNMFIRPPEEDLAEFAPKSPPTSANEPPASQPPMSAEGDFGAGIFPEN